MVEVFAKGSRAQSIATDTSDSGGNLSLREGFVKSSNQTDSACNLLWLSVAPI